MSHAFRIAAAALAAGLMTPAYAGDKFQRIEFFGAWGQIDQNVNDVTFDGWGGGLRVVGGRRVGPFADLQAEFIPTEERDSGADLDLENYRAGVGFGLPAFQPVGFFQVKVEYVAIRLDSELPLLVNDSQNGVGVHLQFEQDLARNFGIHASLGWLNLDDADGTEYVIGFHWVPDVYGFFAQFRWDDLDLDSGADDIEVGTVRAGFRVPF
ncbi:MAG: hypothetical protein ACPHN2_16840 [Sinimarinibacterium flocculans]|uniref:hypothetical protein n=1 Tax=Sinimarinibacterium flocculans TaxID=985250 RepID=UPI002EC7E264|nr:hypothetical protein [Pseudomonadota bacterium]